ncbi:helix-turn-helix transcriptional regulator [Clostridium pasteurianum]|uniref:Putative transcriptional regulator n=1 Tax=Clostridium pasteurianum BC1 TaxID=86416 RepID=R4JYL1_CLOPA|nr:helix-turn-helix transcriptional regulator [Clostridium pasteurianum]AGK95917.1 putative transcriptional regulator [Clostridium pasteurianum BC1]
MYKIFKEKTLNYKWNNWMKFLRDLNKWTKKEAAERCMTDIKLYGMWENGVHTPRKESQKNIAKAFGVRVEDLFIDIPKKSLFIMVICFSLT